MTLNKSFADQFVTHTDLVIPSHAEFVTHSHVYHARRGVLSHDPTKSHLEQFVTHKDLMTHSNREFVRIIHIYTFVTSGVLPHHPYQIASRPVRDI